MAISSPSSPLSNICATPKSPPFSRPYLPAFPPAKRATMLPPRLIQHRGKQFPALRVAALHTAATPCLDTQTSPSSATLYQLLQIPQTATQAEIKASYRRLARLYHPDVVAMEEDKEISTKLFLHINAAYAALSDAQSRASYDLQLSLQAHEARGHSRRAFSLAQEFSRTTQACSSSRSLYCAGARKGRSWETDQCWC